METAGSPEWTNSSQDGIDHWLSYFVKKKENIKFKKMCVSNIVQRAKRKEVNCMYIYFEN